ncbi:MAG: NAD(+) kinase [Pseudomonadota bacterium]
MEWIEEPSFQRVGLVARRSRYAEAVDPAVLDSVRDVAALVEEAEIELLVEQKTARALDRSSDSDVSRADLGKHCDLVIVVGGDGSLLGVGRELAGSRVPVIGVNRGALGFLAGVAPEEIATQLKQVLLGKYVAEDHFLLEAWVERDGEERSRSVALNDVVVHPGSMARMLEISLTIDGQYVYDQRSDGLIVASPTGSTAYALSAGGPIMHPSLNAVVIVPMFPHTLTSRPLVVGGDSQLDIRIGAQGYPTAEASCDSQVHQALEVDDVLHIAKYPVPLKLLYPLEHSFYGACRSKLDWASRLGKTGA